MGQCGDAGREDENIRVNTLKPLLELSLALECPPTLPALPTGVTSPVLDYLTDNIGSVISFNSSDIDERDTYTKISQGKMLV